jgi:hypothetical protein
MGGGKMRASRVLPGRWNRRLYPARAGGVSEVDTVRRPVGLRSVLDSISNLCSISCHGGDLARPGLGRPIAAPLERCAELLGVDLATVRQLAVNIEPYLRADGTRIWSLMLLERQLRPEVYGQRRGGTSTVDGPGAPTPRHCML